MYRKEVKGGDDWDWTLIDDNREVLAEVVAASGIDIENKLDTIRKEMGEANITWKNPALV